MVDALKYPISEFLIGLFNISIYPFRYLGSNTVYNNTKHNLVCI